MFGDVETQQSPRMDPIFSDKSPNTIVVAALDTSCLKSNGIFQPGLVDFALMSAC